MQASSATIDIDTAPSESNPKIEYEPKMFGNKFIKKNDISKNPIYNLASIGIEARNGKLPKIESFQELLTNSNEYIQDRIEKVRQDPQYWIQQGVRTGFFVSAGLQAAR